MRGSVRLDERQKYLNENSYSVYTDLVIWNKIKTFNKYLDNEKIYKWLCGETE